MGNIQHQKVCFVKNTYTAWYNPELYQSRIIEQTYGEKLAQTTDSGGLMCDKY